MTGTSPEAEGSEARRERSYALADLTWKEVTRILDRDARIILPVAALEQHGTHLPLGTSALVVEALVADVSQELGVLRAPVLSYGVNVPGPGRFPGRATLRRKTLHRAVNEIMASWEEDGVREFVLVTAHGYEPHVDALLMALTRHSSTTVVDLHAVDVRDLVLSPPELEHAGELETSLLRFLAPDRVREGEITDLPLNPRDYRKYVRGRSPTPPAGSGGAVGRPSLASVDKGRAIYARYRETLRSALVRSRG